MQTEKSYDTTIRVSKFIKSDVLYLKRLLNITSDDKNFCQEDAIQYAIKFTLENDKSLEKVHDELTYITDRGRLYELYDKK